MRALLEQRGQWEKLCADPRLVPDAVEEMLRFVTPVQNFVRRVQHDTELAGKRLRAGEYVALFYGSANRDEAVFGADAERLRHHAAPTPTGTSPSASASTSASAPRSRASRRA